MYYITNPGINQGKETTYCICLTSFHVKKLYSSLKICFAVVKEKAFRKKAACAVTMAQAVFLLSGDFSEVVDKSRL